MLTLKELSVLNKIGELWNEYENLPKEFREGGHHEDEADFRYHIHRLEDLIASRPTYRDLRSRKDKDGRDSN